jgi:DnaK suppressor protein
MVKADVRLVRKILEARLKEATSSKALGDAIRIHQVADPVDMTQEAAERDVAVQLLDRDSALVRHLRSAIARMEDGSYGLCLQCEEEIAPTRLKAIPWAEMCIRCQEQAEILASQRKGMPTSVRQTEAA